jgi:FtsH-binding integral membrane protein
MSYAEQNAYSNLRGLEAQVAALASESERATFIRRTYAHLALAVLGFVAIEAAIFSLVSEQTLGAITLRLGGWGWLIFLGGFMVVSWVARTWAESTTSIATQYLGLALYVVAQALLFVPLLYVAYYFVGDPNLIPTAGLITLIVFAGLTVAVFITGADVSYLRRFLFWGGIVALGAVVCATIFGLSLGLWFSLAMIALASGYILYDTSNILHHYRTEQYVAASLALFASVALLLWYVIRLLIYFSNSD